MRFFIQNDNLCEKLFVFLPNNNAKKAVEKVVEYTIMNFENKDIPSALLIDLTKAFVSMVISYFWTNNITSCITGKEFNLFSSYLNNRKRTVVQGQDNSELKTAQIEVQQR